MQSTYKSKMIWNDPSMPVQEGLKSLILDIEMSMNDSSHCKPNKLQRLSESRAVAVGETKMRKNPV